ncbi:MAG: SRPBCC family protein [Candidatus Bathyarchaeota archaeon]|nr:SRPBCC family protein [Candidatus Bathyarchaeota archaeon]
MAKTVKITQKTLIPATPGEVYDAYIDAEKQSKFTGSVATSDPRVGGEFTSWDGYITGKYLALEPGKKIVQEWTSSDFPEGVPPSRFEIVLREAKGGTELTMTHSGVPEEMAEDIGQGWKDYYWEPMKKYFKSRKR